MLFSADSFDSTDHLLRWKAGNGIRSLLQNRPQAADSTDHLFNTPNTLQVVDAGVCFCFCFTLPHVQREQKRVVLDCPR